MPEDTKQQSRFFDIVRNKTNTVLNSSDYLKETLATSYNSRNFFDRIHGTVFSNKNMNLDDYILNQVRESNDNNFKFSKNTQKVTKNIIKEEITKTMGSAGSPFVRNTRFIRNFGKHLYQNSFPLAGHWSGGFKPMLTGQISRAAWENMGWAQKKLMSPLGSIEKEFIKKGSELTRGTHVKLSKGSRVGAFGGGLVGKIAPKLYMADILYTNLTESKNKKHGAAVAATTIAANALVDTAIGVAEIGILPELVAGFAAYQGISYFSKAALDTYNYMDFKKDDVTRLTKRRFANEYQDFYGAITMRQQALNSMQRSYLSARQFVLGNESTYLADF